MCGARVLHPVQLCSCTFDPPEQGQQAHRLDDHGWLIVERIDLAWCARHALHDATLTDGSVVQDTSASRLACACTQRENKA